MPWTRRLQVIGGVAPGNLPVQSPRQPHGRSNEGLKSEAPSVDDDGSGGPAAAFSNGTSSSARTPTQKMFFMAIPTPFQLSFRKAGAARSGSNFLPSAAGIRRHRRETRKPRL